MLSQKPGGRRQAKRGSTVTITVGQFVPDADAHDAAAHDPDHTARDADHPARAAGHAMRVAVLSGGRSSEHEISLASGASVRAGLAEAGHDVRRRARSARDGTLAHATARRSRCAPGAACWAPTSPSRSSTAPSARTGRSRACSSAWTSPTSGAGVLASALCMDKVVFKERHGPRGLPQVDYVAVDARAGAATRSGRGRVGRSGCRCSSSPRGWARRSASPR